MADATAPNGTSKLDLVKVVASLLAICIVSVAALGALTMFYSPAQWDLVKSIIEDVDTLAVMLAGGLLGMVTPKGNT